MPPFTEIQKVCALLQMFSPSTIYTSILQMILSGVDFFPIFNITFMVVIGAVLFYLLAYEIVQKKL